MKYIVIATLMLSGCSGVYDFGKGVYTTGKEVVILNADLLDENNTAKLKRVDDVATRIDKTKEVIEK